MQIPPPISLDYVREGGESYLEYTEFKNSAVHRVRLACIIQMLRQAVMPGQGRILEIGCGVGNIAMPIASLGYQITACDIHEPSILMARNRNLFSNLQFIHGSIESVNPGEYDAIILTEVLEHVNKYRNMVSLIAGSMKSNSILIITVPNGWGITEILCRPSYALKKWPIGVAVVKFIKSILKTADLTTANLCSPHVNFFTFRRLIKLFEDYNLIIVSFHRCFFLWPLWETFLSKRSYPNGWPENDFKRSQNLPPSVCAFWAFALQK
jgi:2-polyprenyl-3-methyl-5-hydroxy-6-metoxy-1,4-benzoquinol methylase